MNNKQERSIKRLRESNDPFLSIFNDIPNPVIITNPDMSIRYVNPAFERLTGFSLSEVTGATAPYPWWPEEKRKEYAAELQAIRTGKKHKADWCFRAKDGTTFWIKAEVTPVKEDGEVKYLVASWVDITEYKYSEYSLKAKIAQLNKFYFQLIMSGKLKLDQRSFRVTELLAIAHAELIRLAANHKLIIKIPALLPEVYIDETLIVQVLESLVENAAKFSPPSSQIDIEAQLSGDWLIINITDEGPGISAEIQDKIFSLEFETDKLASDNFLSHGLGLPLCRGIVEAHGGNIWAEKQPVKGTKFSFTLPIIRQV